MFDLILELGNAALIAAILAYLWRAGYRAGIRRQRGWVLILAGFSLVFFGTLLDVLQLLPAFQQGVLGDNRLVHRMMDTLLGELAGFFLLALGFLNWIPTVIGYRRTAADLRRSQAELEDRVAQRSAELSAVNGQLQDEIAERKQAQSHLSAALDDARQRQTEMSALLLSSCMVIEQTSFQQAAQTILTSCKNLVGATAGYIALAPGEGSPGQTVFLDAGNGLRRLDAPSPALPHDAGDKWYAQCATRYENCLSENDPFALLADGHTHLASALFAPLLVKGETLGMLVLGNKPAGFSDNDAQLAAAFADMAAMALQNRQLIDLREASERRLRSVVETANDAIITANDNGEVVSWNRAAQTIFGYTAEEMAGRSLITLIPERLRPAHQAGILRAAATGQTRVMGSAIESIGLRRDGIEFPIEMSIARWYAGDGSFFTALMRDITERKRVQEALREANQALEHLVQSSPLAIIVLDNESTVRLWNPAAERIYGWTEQELIGRPYPIVPPAKMGEFEMHRRQALQGYSHTAVETWRQKKDGSPIDVSIWTSPLHRADGGVSGTLCMMADITDRVRAEAELRRRAGEQQALYTIASAVTGTLDLDTLLPRVLDTVVPVVDAAAGWIMLPDPVHAARLRVAASRGLPQWQAGPEQVFVPLQSCAIYGAMTPEQEPDRLGVAANCGNCPVGRTPGLPAETHTCVALIAGSQVLGVLAVGWDDHPAGPSVDPRLLVTIGRQVGMAVRNAQLYHAARQVDRLQMLVELDRALAASLDSNKVAEVTLHRIAVAVDAPLGMIRLVPAAACPPDQAATMFYRGWAGDPRVWWPVLTAKLEQGARLISLAGDELAAASGNAELGERWGAHGLVVPIWGDEDLLAVLALGGRPSGRPFGEEDRALIHVAARHAGQALQNSWLYAEVMRLLYEREQTRAQFMQSGKMAALGRLLSSIAHEINNPLQAVQNYLGLLHKELNGEQRREALDRYVGVVQDEIERVSGILGSLRDYYCSAPEAMGPTDLRLVVSHVLDLVEEELQRGGVKVVQAWSPALPLVEANPHHLNQVFLNMIINAVDAMPGGGTLRIEASAGEIASNDGGRLHPAVRVQLADTGQGMSAATQVQLFEPFFTTKPHGAGLGLYVTYGIIISHNGQIHVDSKEGEGTTFAIVLPVEQPREDYQ